MAETINVKKQSGIENVFVHCIMFFVLIATLKRFLKFTHLFWQCVQSNLLKQSTNFWSVSNNSEFFSRERVGLPSSIVLVLGNTGISKIVFCRAGRNPGHSSRKWLTVYFLPHTERYMYVEICIKDVVVKKIVVQEATPKT